MVRSLLAPASIDAFHVYFPDPWWKKRHHKRRLFQPELCEALAETRDVAIRIHGVHSYGESGTGAELYAKHALDAAGITRVARDFVRSDARTSGAA